MRTETKRLWLREWTADDRPALAAILQDPQVTAVYRHRFTDSDIDAWLERQRQRYAQDGHGLWAMVEKEPDRETVCDPGKERIVGQAGLTFQPWGGEPVLEIGYLLHHDAQHRGYAREAAAACRRYAFETLQAQEVCSIIVHDNAASMRVAQSLGLVPYDQQEVAYYAGKERHIRFRQTRAQWEEARRLGLPRGIVKLCPHTEEWEQEAERTMGRLRQIFGSAARDIQHVGSTSVPDLWAKPILDLAVAVADFAEVDARLEALEAAGFRHVPENDDVGQRFFSVWGESPEIRTLHLHVVRENSREWRQYVGFRDYLRENAPARRQYEAVKRRLMGAFPEDRVSYTEGKAPFIQAILKDIR